ncbi:MAG TPA: class I SAM-dependent methyltransferase [Acidimicrobiales bacterium]
MSEPLDRQAWVDTVIADPPPVHPEKPTGVVWRTQTSCYRFIADQVGRGSRTLETGAGLSTVLFAAWGCDHLAVVPFPDEAVAVEAYCDSHGIDRTTLRFDLRPSEVALPTLVGDRELDLVFVDGCHGYPMPVVDWFYGAGMLRSGGVLVLDDLQLPQVRNLVDTFLDSDPRWERLRATDKWIAFRRTTSGPLAEMESEQAFFPLPPRSVADRIKAAVPPKLVGLVKR